MQDYEIEGKIRDLERKVEDLEYDLARTRQELGSRIDALRQNVQRKADKY